MKLIVGLGNPGSRYRNTYHNLGFMAVEEFARRNNIRFAGKECSSLTAKGRMGGEDYVVAKPQTFMNLSGQAVKELLRRYGVADGDLLVVYDDADLPVGRMRLRREGSAGTHNGMRNIIAENNISDFKRLRIGTANEELAEHKIALVDYVLNRVDFDDRIYIERCVSVAADAIADFVKGADLEKIMSYVNAYDGKK